MFMANGEMIVNEIETLEADTPHSLFETESSATEFRMAYWEGKVLEAFEQLESRERKQPTIVKKRKL